MTSKRENWNSDCKYVGDGKIGSGRTKLFSSVIYLNVSVGPVHQVFSLGCRLFSEGAGLTALGKGNVYAFWSSESSVALEPSGAWVSPCPPASSWGWGAGGQRGGVSFLMSTASEASEAALHPHLPHSSLRLFWPARCLHPTGGGAAFPTVGLLWPLGILCLCSSKPFIKYSPHCWYCSVSRGTGRCGSSMEIIM